MNCKIIFFDVDGTLINYEDGSIVKSTKTALQLLKKQRGSTSSCYGQTAIHVSGINSLRHRYVYYS